MLNYSFVADSTMPGLGASELSRIMAGTVASGDSEPSGRASYLLRRAWRSDRRLLRDLGIDRDGC